MKKAHKELAEKMIDVLNGRGGFDHWWDGIERSTQREIIRELADAIADFKEIPVVKREVDKD